MKTKILKKLSMFQAIKAFMESNHKKWEIIVELENALSKFNRNLEFIKGFKSNAETDISKLKLNRDESKKVLLAELSTILNLLKAYSNDYKIKGFFGKNSKFEKKPDKIKSAKLVAYSDKILKESKKIFNKHEYLAEGEIAKGKKQGNISNYGLSSLMLTNLNKSVQNFKNANNLYQQAKSQKEKYLDEIKFFIKKNEKILTGKIDLLISVFKSRDNEFFNKYNATRNATKPNPRVKEKSDTKKPESKAETVKEPKTRAKRTPKTVKPVGETKRRGRPPVNKTITRTRKPRTPKVVTEEPKAPENEQA